MAETCLSLTTISDDGSVHRRSWPIPAENTEDVARILADILGKPREMLVTAETVERINAADLPGIVAL